MSATMSAWSVTYLLHSTLLIGLVWLAARWIRSASARNTLWKVALCGGIVTATLQTVVPVDSAVARVAPPRVTFDRTVFESMEPRLEATARNAGPAGVRAPSGATVALGVWSILALVLLLRLALGHGRFLAALGGRLELTDGPERERLDRLCAAAGVRRIVRLTRSPALASPVAMLGWEIVIPGGTFERLSEQQRETILAHELSHLMRRDPLWLTLGELIKAVLFFQPLNWMAQARAKETAEFLSDDAAVLQTGQPKALAETLAALAAHPAPAPPAVAAMAEGGSNLVIRVKRVLQANPTAPLHAGMRLAIALAVLTVTTAFAPGMVASVMRSSGTVLVNEMTDAVLSQDFEGPEGRTQVSFEAREAEIALDASFVRFTKRNGFVRATQTSERGPRRRVEVLPGSGEPTYRYQVDGVETPWCDDARLVIVAAFSAEKAYAGSVPVPTEPAERTRRTRSGSSEWKATIELTGTEDGVPTYLSITANGLLVNYGTGEVELKPGGRVDVVERHGTQERTFRMDEDGKTYGGAFDTQEKEPWLAGILDRKTDLPKSVIRTLVR